MGDENTKQIVSKFADKLVADAASSAPMSKDQQTRARVDEIEKISKDPGKLQAVLEAYASSVCLSPNEKSVSVLPGASDENIKKAMVSALTGTTPDFVKNNISDIRDCSPEDKIARVITVAMPSSTTIYR